MSIPVSIDPLGTLGDVELVDEYVTGITLSIPTGLTLKDSLGFEVTAEVRNSSVFDFAGWAYLFYLGGLSATGWFGMQHFGGRDQTVWTAGNNGGSNDNVRLEADAELFLVLNKDGLRVNGTLNSFPTSVAKNKTTEAILKCSNLCLIKKITFTNNGVLVCNIRAARTKGMPCLVDTVTGIIYKP